MHVFVNIVNDVVEIVYVTRNVSIDENVDVFGCVVIVTGTIAIFHVCMSKEMTGVRLVNF